MSATQPAAAVFQAASETARHSSAKDLATGLTLDTLKNTLDFNQSFSTCLKLIIMLIAFATQDSMVTHLYSNKHQRL